ncbi:MAG: DUF6460 domain-containing protein [Hyphomicrobiaceae bacterium]|nr:DUF6460 domain-containing protein [Hyphomicrobiaceae bacterium]
MERFIGGSLLGVFIRLVLLSIIVGIVLAALGLEPFDVVNSVQRLVERLYDMGYETLQKGFSYFLTGALLVVPIWIIARLMKVGGARKKENNDPEKG